MKKYWFLFQHNNILLQETDGTFAIPLSEEPPVSLEGKHVMEIEPMPDDTEVRACFMDEVPAGNAEYALCGLRQSFYKLSPELYRKAGKCYELLYWDHHTQYCGICGAPMAMSTNISKRCTHCGNEVWPQLSTAIIVRITRGDEVLLVHARNFKTNFYGLVAGFVETGETLEEAVYREVREETGLTIDNLRYFGSQPWPYPCGLMVGFTADYISGDVSLQQSELSSGGWFRRDSLPTIPEKLSIARMLLDDWLKS